MTARDFELACPAPFRHRTVQLAHGGGGRLSRELVEQIFIPAFGGAALSARHDSAVVEAPRGRIALTTDGYVVRPLFFPGGDIGKLAVCGTINDLAMTGAAPRWLAVAFVLEEGLPMEDLHRVVASMRDAARASGMEIVTGDTKVVDRGKGDGMFITTTGVGVVPEGITIEPRAVRPGDVVLVSGDLGRHGIAVLSTREGLTITGALESDCAPLDGLVAALLSAGVVPHCLRDPTRGGLASALNEIALDAGVDIDIDERAVPVNETVAGACELFGLDPLYVACEGRLVAFVPEEHAAAAIEVMRAHPAAPEPARIGTVRDNAAPGRAGRVTLRSRLGMNRWLDIPAGEQLPRIC
ncbi:hydrogenase expression/formation protein HypE [Polyangium sorediatum]|uniref:Hydrogenase expression/formation protein HypE n=1 Tax=Polyangium sorediatum TaxID=889274 RepID=A0ABT6P6R0_9BACT|nr:hydrogenase expression/formation protein HypE [Polyangium sorediatum]MDI1436231.1 hydrogenase expression/formation protein HypE [Polyangium sorediatum]